MISRRLFYLRLSKCHDCPRLFRKGLRGFSFVELLVAVSIMVVLFSLGYSNYRDFQRRQHLESAVRMVKADLRLAQEMALAGSKPSHADCNASDLQGYIFDGSGASSYEILASCTGGDVSVKTVDLPAGIQISFFGDDRFRFNVLGQGIDKGSNVITTLSFPDGGVSSTNIIITTVGEITEGGVGAPCFEECTISGPKSCDEYCSDPSVGKTCVSSCSGYSCTNRGRSFYFDTPSIGWIHLGCDDCGVSWFGDRCSLSSWKVYCCCQ